MFRTVLAFLAKIPAKRLKINKIKLCEDCTMQYATAPQKRYTM